MIDAHSHCESLEPDPPPAVLEAQQSQQALHTGPWAGFPAGVADILGAPKYLDSHPHHG
jgi:hypothetical protein